MRVSVPGRFDGGARSATVVVTRELLLSVRPYRRRRTYELPLAAVAQGVVYDVVRAELAARRRAGGRR
jgi:hypothetical protein